MTGSGRLGLRSWPSPPLGFHQASENVVDSRYVAFAFGFQPNENARVKTHTHCHFAPYFSQTHHLCQLLVCQAWYVVEIDMTVVSSPLEGCSSP